MKVMAQNYSFDHTSKKITINDVSSIKLEDVLMITNVTANVIIYTFAASLGAVVSNNTITLTALDTSLMNDTDSLQIFIDIPDVNSGNNDVLQLLKRMVKLLEPLATVDVNNRQKIAVEVMPSITIGTMPASTTVASTTGVGYPISANTVGGNPYALTGSQPAQLIASIVDQRWEMMEFSHIAYGNIRNKLIFS